MEKLIYERIFQEEENQINNLEDLLNYFSTECGFNLQNQIYVNPTLFSKINLPNKIAYDYIEKVKNTVSWFNFDYLYAEFHELGFNENNFISWIKENLSTGEVSKIMEYLEGDTYDLSANKFFQILVENNCLEVSWLKDKDMYLINETLKPFPTDNKLNFVNSKIEIPDEKILLKIFKDRTIGDERNLTDLGKELRDYLKKLSPNNFEHFSYIGKGDNDLFQVSFIYDNLNIGIYIDFEKAKPFLMGKTTKEVIKDLQNKEPNKTNKFDELLLKKIQNPIIYQVCHILSVVLRVPNILSKVFTYKDLKQLSNQNSSLAQMLSKQLDIKGEKINLLDYSLKQKGLLFQELIQLDKELTQYEKEKNSKKETKTIVELLGSNGLEVNLNRTWSGAQIYFKDLTNYVFQVNIKKSNLEKVLDYTRNIKNSDTEVQYLKYYIRDSNHPTSKTTLTYSWIRYTKFSENEIVLDEIQTDLDGSKFFGKDLMKGWDVFTMNKFIKYVRNTLKIRKIYLPTYETKVNEYHANPPMYLYKELPNKFGFKKKHNNEKLEGFMLLEGKKRS